MVALHIPSGNFGRSHRTPGYDVDIGQKPAPRPKKTIRQTPPMLGISQPWQNTPDVRLWSGPPWRVPVARVARCTHHEPREGKRNIARRAATRQQKSGHHVRFFDWVCFADGEL